MAIKRSKGYGLSREGVPFVLAVVLLALLTNEYVGPAWSLPWWLFTIFLVYCFRRSDRVVPPSPLGIVSPADGTVLAVEEVADPFLQRPAKRITLRMHRLGEYVLRAPTEGKLVMQWHLRRGTLSSRGSSGEQSVDQAALLERAKRLDGLWIRTDEADDLVLELKVAPWPKPRCYGLVGERLGQGHRCGFVAFGGVVSVYVPANAKINIAAGDIVYGGNDVIAAFVHG